MKKIIALSMAMAVLVPTFAQRQNLSLNLSTGNTYAQVSTVVVSIRQTINGQQMDIKMNVNGAIHFKVTGETDSAYDLEASYDSLFMRMELPNETMEFGSTKRDENDVMSTVLAALVGQPFGVKMTRLGRVTDVEDIESLFSGALDQFPQIPDAQKRQIVAQLSQSFGEKAFKGNLEMVSAIFPETPVSVGDTWTVQTQLEAGMAAQVRTTYELKEAHETYYLIAGNSVIATEDKDAYVESNGMPLKYNLSGTLVSTIKVARETGWIMDAKLAQNVGGSAEIKDNPQLPGGMVIPMTMVSETIITDR